MDDQLTISTPEQVAFHYEVAGIGSRFLAALLDHLIITVAIYLVYCGGLALMSGVVATGTADSFLNATLAIITLIIFLIIWGYFVLFEILWNGQTPAKRAGHLRVIRTDGQPIRAGEALIRNLVRLIDFLPGFYGIGFIAMFINRDARRLGDLAANTLVIREPTPTLLHNIRVMSQSPVATTDPTRNPHSTFRNTYDPLPGVSLHALTPDDYRLIREVVARARRAELAPDRAQNLALQLSQGIATRIGHDYRDWQSRGWSPIVFLESVLIARDARGD